MTKIVFEIEDDIKLSSETVEINADSLPFDIPTDAGKLKSLCRSVAMLKGHYKESVISNIRIVKERVLPQRYDAYSVHKFAEYLQEYAKACEETGYDGISAMDIEEKMQEFLK